MGWNKLQFVKPSPLLEGLDEDFVYFVHSYYVDAVNSEVLLAKARLSRRGIGSGGT